MKSNLGVIESNINDNNEKPWLPRQIGFALCACLVAMFADVLWELFSIAQTSTRQTICGVRIAVVDSHEQLSIQLSFTPWCLLFAALFIAVWLLIAGIIHHRVRTGNGR